MTLQEAIKEGTEEVKHPYRAKKMSRPDALKLLIEAGELTIDFREGKARRFTDLLPSETKD